jgi:S1-C subfamily serine protease
MISFRVFTSIVMVFISMLIVSCKTTNMDMGQGPISLSKNVIDLYNNRYKKEKNPWMFFVNKNGTHASYLQCPEHTCSDEYYHGITLCEKGSGEKCYIFDEWNSIVWNGPITWNKDNSFSSKIDSKEASCRRALNLSTGIWEVTPNLINAVNLAKKMGLTEEICRSILQLKSKPSIQTVNKKQKENYSNIEEENKKLAREISRLKKQNQSKSEQVAKTPSPKKSPPPKSGTTGSGFFVSKLGHIITNEHIVRQCGSVTVGDNAEKQVTALVLGKDQSNDLALLRISSTQQSSAETLSLISKLGAQKLGLKLVPLASGGLMRSDDIELGESVLVAGYPYGELYSNTIKVTGGMVSAVKGMGDDSGQFQMDAAVQPGNSGGPIYDENGNIVGVVISQLNKLKVAKAIGSLPENVNFGIKASTVRQFLTSAGLPTKWSNRTERKSTKELAQIAKNQTVMVVCNP